MKLSTYAKKLGVTYQTAWSHFKQGLIKGAYQLETGTVVVPEDIFEEKRKETEEKIVAIYARVSSSENKENLSAQADRLKQYSIAKGYQIVHVVKEVGSGVNDSRKKLEKLLKEDDWNILLVEHKDRLTRFGFNYLETLLNKENKRIEVVNVAENETADLIDDLIAIIYSFSARMYGVRRAKRKTQKIVEQLREEDDS